MVTATWGATMAKAKGSMAADIIGAIRKGTKKWMRTVKSEERNPVSRGMRYSRMTRERGKSFKDAAAEILPAAYDRVSGGGALPANARQLMYACRPHIQKETGRELNSVYFTQVLLPDYLDETGVAWNVVYDARGHFAEPHDGERFGVGTLEVRDYLDSYDEPERKDAELRQARIETSGPDGNFGAVLFIEKEGFSPLLRAAKIAEKYDLAIMSTKGMSVVAARTLVDEMCFTYGIPLLILHDFDKAGFSIAGTLQRDTRRYQFQNDIDVIDLGLALRDVEAMGLESEYQVHPKGKKRLLMDNLRENGATDAEIEFMFKDFDNTRSTRRVELNAMTSPQFVAFLERKLKEHGIAKVIPDEDELAAAYKFFVRNLDIEKAIERELKRRKSDEDAIKVPDNLADQVRKTLSTRPQLRWDSAVYKAAGEKLKAEPKSEPSKKPEPEPNIMRRVTDVLGEDWNDPTKPDAP
jgi:hypothetical protein